MNIYTQDDLAKILLRQDSPRKPTRRAIMKALEKAGIAYKQGIDGVFTTHEAINAALLGVKVAESADHRIELL